MRVATHTWEEPDDVTQRLKDLGLSKEILREAVYAYAMGLAAATANDPPNAGGFMAYVYSTRALREMLIPRGWRRDNSGGYCRVVNDAAGVAITVSTGDEHTGGAEGEAPRTKRSKGPRTVAAVADNVLQLSLFDQSDHDTADGAGDDSSGADGCVTWVLLMHATPSGIQSELSLPVELDDSHRIGEWRERIILPVTPLDGPSLAPIILPEPGPDFDVSVTRRTG